MLIEWEEWKRKLEVPKDEDAPYTNDTLTNRDIIPIPPERRSWTPIAYATYWVVEGGCSVTGWTTGSSLVGYGLSVKQAILCSMGAGFIYGLFAALMGYIGSHHHIGYPVIARMAYGIRGSIFGIILRIITGIIWWGVQAVYGGQAIAQLLVALSPSFGEWDTFHDKNDITSRVFVGLFLYCVFMIPCSFIPPEKLHLFFRISIVIALGAFFGIMGYCIKTAGGVGDMFYEPSTKFTTKGDLAGACIKGMLSIVGSAGTGILGQSDFTRYSSKKNGPVLSQIFGAPIALTFSCIIGVLATSAAEQFLGEVIWNPITLLGYIQKYENNSSAVRAGIFFGSFAFALQQMAINLLLNCLSSSMDMVGLCPKYINIKRGSCIVMMIGILIWPWKILTSAQAVVVFGNGWGCFCSSQTGVIVAKYFFIYRRKILLKDLYVKGCDSIYWYYHGVDWRSIVSFVLGTVFLMPGLAWDALGRTSDGFWMWIYRISYFWGIIISLASTLILNLMLLPKKNIMPDTKVDDVYNIDGSRIDCDSLDNEEIIYHEGQSIELNDDAKSGNSKEKGDVHVYSAEKSI